MLFVNVAAAAARNSLADDFARDFRVFTARGWTVRGVLALFAAAAEIIALGRWAELETVLT